MGSGLSISIRYVDRILDAAAKAGLDPAALSAEAALRPVGGDSDARVSADSYLRLWGLVMQGVSDPAFPLRVAETTGIETYDLFGFVCMTGRDLRDAFSRAGRYVGIYTDLVRWELHLEGGIAAMRLVPAQEGQPEGRFAAECTLAEMMLATRRYFGIALEPLEVHFRWRTPRVVSHLEQFYNAPLKFEMPYTALVFEERYLGLPLVKSDSAMSLFFSRHAEELLKQVPQSIGTSGQVRTLIAQSFGGKPATLESVASTLMVSSRTLRRRLEEEGQTFQKLLQETRCALAKQHLREERLSIGEIAFVLGFSDVSTFHRSFRRWTGQTPAAFRREARGR